MIFVTLGTHEQPFNRLIEYIDNLKRDSVITEEVVIQTGFSTYKPKCCKWMKLFAYKVMEEYVNEAHIIITHGGPASFIMPMRIGKVPIVVPRQYQFNEHVNNHQVDFTKAVAERMGTIIPVIDIKELKDKILNYDDIVSSMKSGFSSNNGEFNRRLEEMVEQMNIK